MSSCVIAPSILSADPLHLLRDVQCVVDAGAIRLHIDVMDNHYVPNLTMGPRIVQHLKAAGIKASMDVHLMVKPARSMIDVAIESGADSITIHPDASEDVLAELNYIREHNVAAGLALNPSVPISSLLPFREHIDLVLLMSVEPGFSGQSFIASCLPKIASAREWIDDPPAKSSITLVVDGGVCLDNIASIRRRGADYVVCGSALFGHSPLADQLKALQIAAQMSED
jgi:ribulose-phosphate 3-epimerase